MSKSKYTNTANAGRLRRRGQSVPKNLLTSEDRFIDGTCKKEATETLKALAERHNVRERFQRFNSFPTSYPGLKQPRARTSERLRRFREPLRRFALELKLNSSQHTKYIDSGWPDRKSV